jgi:hypothetical protein
MKTDENINRNPNLPTRYARNERVVITRGFYKGLKGNIMGFQARKDAATGYLIIEYHINVNISKDEQEIITLNEENIKKNSLF